jgi:hypothetical protein
MERAQFENGIAQDIRQDRIARDRQRAIAAETAEVECR